MDRLKCRTPHCRRLTKARSPFCGRCASRMWRESHPLTATFQKLRTNARRRGHAFTLTLPRFEELVRASGYLERKGKTAKSLSIDRIDPRRGYHDDNVRVVTLSVNSRLRYVDRLPQWMREELEKELAKTAETDGSSASGSHR